MASGQCNWSSQEVCQQAEVFEGNGLSFVDIFLFAAMICNLQRQNRCSELTLMCCGSCAFSELPHILACSTFLDAWRV